MATNVDLLENGGDHHKMWDIYPGPHETQEEFIAYLLRLWGKGKMTDAEAAQKGLALRSARGMPEHLRTELSKIAGPVEGGAPMHVEKMSPLDRRRIGGFS